MVSQLRTCVMSVDSFVLGRRGSMWIPSGEMLSDGARMRRELTAEMCKTLPSGGSMRARVKLEGIDGRAPQERVEHVA